MELKEEVEVDVDFDFRKKKKSVTISRASGASEGQRILLPARALFPRSYATATHHL